MKRNVALDSIKGILIILVVLGHALQYGYGIEYERLNFFYDDYLFRAIYCFHMPLFMFISGYLFYKSNQERCQFVILSKLKVIGVPYIVYATLIIILHHILSQSHFYLSYYLRMIRMGTEMWFLWSLLVNCITVSLVKILTKGGHVLMAVFLGMICFISLFVSDNDILPQHKFVFLFFIMGYYYNVIGIKMIPYLKKLYFFFFLSTLYILCIIIYGKDMMIYQGGFCVVRESLINLGQFYKDIIRWGIGLISSCWIVVFYYLIIEKWKIVTIYLTKVGKNTLAIYGIQSLLYVILSHILKIYNIRIPHYYLWAVFVCLIILLFCQITIEYLKKVSICRRLFLGKK